MRDRSRVLLLSSLALLALQAPAAAQLTAEFAIDHPVARNDPHDQIIHGIAAGPSGWLVVWTSDRDPDGTPTYAARVDATGAILDPHGIELEPKDDTHVQIAWDGTQWLVVSAFGVTGGIRGQTISATGEVGTPFTVASGGATIRWPSMACGATECMVVWWRFESGVGHGVRLARIVDGAVTATELPTTVSTTDAHEPAISWDGTNYLVVWRDIRRADGGDIYGQRISPAGALVGADFPISLQAGTEDQPAVAWNGSRHLVVWRDTRSGSAQLFGARVTAAGAVVAADADGFLVDAAPGGNPMIAWNGTEHLVGWDGGAIRMSTSGAPQGTLAIPATAVRPLAASSAGTFLLAYRDREIVYDDWDLYAARVTPTALEQRFWVAGVPSTERWPAAAHDGTNHLLVWHDQRDGAGAVYGTRVSEAGASLDGAGFRISDEGVEVRPPVVAWSGDSYLVVWARRPAHVPAAFVFEGRRVDAAGTVLDVDPIVIAPYIPGLGSKPHPAVVWNGQSFLIVWEDDDYILGTRVGADGALLDAMPFQISTQNGQGRYPALAWSGTVHLAVWYDSRVGMPRIYGARLGLDGRPLDGGDFEICEAASFYSVPALAGSEHGFLVGAGEARRLDAAGNLIDEEPLALPGLVEERPHMGWDGASYLVAWSFVSTTGDYVGHYRAARLGLRGEILDYGMDVATTPAVSTTDNAGPIVAPASGTGRSTLFYPLRIDNSTPPLLQEVHLHGRGWSEALVQVDAGVPEPPDGGGGGGADAGGDGGNAGGGGGGGCGGCASSGGGLSGPLALLLLMSGLAATSRRRPTRGPADS